MSVTSTDVLVLVDKPVGVTSHDVVAKARRSLGTRRVGHAGTLDPFATGLLILLAGKGTRLMQFVPTEPKVYEATIRFGVSTDTDDITGVAVRTAALPAPSAVDAGIRRLTGTLQQRPPAYSAKHVNGARAYTMARRGEDPVLAPVAVTVSAWEVCARRDDEIDVRISCGTGTYIRALARDLGELTDSAAHLTSLRRISAGPFFVRDANSWDALLQGNLVVRQLPEALPHWKRLALSADDLNRVVRGMRIDADDAHDVADDRAMLVDDRGSLVAIAHRVDATWQPDAVLRES